MHSTEWAKCNYIKLILLVFLFCIVIMLFKDQYEHKLKRDANYGLEALIARGEIDNLFIGSSLFRQGIDIEVLDQYVEDNYVISYNGAQPVLEQWILEYLLRNDVKIHNLYVDMYPYTLCYDIGIEDDKIFSELNLTDKWNLYKCCVRPNDDSFASFYHVFASQNNELLLTWPINKYLINKRFKNGGNIVYVQGMTNEEAEDLPLPILDDASINDYQINAIKQIIMLCREQQINLTFLETPKYYRLSEEESYAKILAIYQDYLVQNEVSFYSAKDVCGENVAEAEFYYDLVHLSSEGRSKYTKLLIERLHMK